MSLTVLVTFPGSMTLDDYQKRVDALTRMGCHLQLSDALTQPLGKMTQKSEKIKAGRAFNQVMTQDVKSDPFAGVEDLTAGESELLDKAMKLTHDSGETPLLDTMSRPTQREMLKDFFMRNPGSPTKQAADELCGQYGWTWASVKQTISKMTMDGTLENRGGGRGRAGQIFVV